ncbi:unnamed protein product [Candidula unifasciata]|uniref:Uncharacterized protein n=1 Tax=Candidula unifasciata TaxID=100452 RepID=A0A8S3YFP2_9EUPU|nr:unnamed protein product [Candidula unifasciata]
MAKRLMKFVQAKLEPIWAQQTTKTAFVIVGTVLGVGIFFFPAFKSMWDAKHAKEYEIYNKDHLYPLQIRKQREQREKEDQQKI